VESSCRDVCCTQSILGMARSEFVCHTLQPAPCTLYPVPCNPYPNFKVRYPLTPPPSLTCRCRCVLRPRRLHPPQRSWTAGLVGVGQHAEHAGQQQQHATVT
jgi:hypothetical protein